MKPTINRLSLLTVCFTAVGLLILWQILSLQNNPKQVSASEALFTNNMSYFVEHESERGRIFDINGNLLAGSKTVYEIGIDLSVLPQHGRNPLTIASTLMQFFGNDYPLDFDRLYAIASTPFHKRDAVYYQIWELKNVPQETIDELAALKEYYAQQRENVLENSRGRDIDPTSLPSLAGLTWRPHLQRFYPEGDLASNVLGFTTFLNPEGKVGMFGVEEYYQDNLVTENVTNEIPRMPFETIDIKDVPQGHSLILTIDRNIQEEVERILDNAVEKNQAKSGTIIVMNPENGAIMAMATTPRANPNQYWNWYEALDQRTSYNKAIMDTYEPGSVFKVITMAIALESGAVTPETTYEDTGYINVGGAPVTNWNLMGMGTLTMGECLRFSSNVCFAGIADENIGAENFYAGLHAFGLSRRTNIDLAGESIFPLKEPGSADWWPADLGRQAFGHSISITPIQLIAASAAIANDGKIMSPHILNSIVINGKQYDNIPLMIANPISEETARIVNEMLIIPETAQDGEAFRAYIPGYTMSGKTGTANIPINAQYVDEKTNTTFIGWGPTDDPQFIIYVWLEKPSFDTFASVVAAPVFREVAEYMITVLGIPPDAVRKSLSP